MEQHIIIQGTSSYIPIEIKSPADSLWLSAEMTEGSMAYLYLFHPEGYLCGSICFGLSGFPKELYISEDLCTMNGLRHRIAEGVYTLAILPLTGQEIAATIRCETNITKSYPEEYCQTSGTGQFVGQTACQSAGQSTSQTVSKSVSQPVGPDEVVDSAHRYYKGDFHGHTIFSDGHQTIQEAMEVLRRQKLDFMAFTEHNSIAFGVPELPCLLIPSFELTLPIGHMNIHGISDMENYFWKLTQADSYEKLWNDTIRCFSDQCNLSLNHMFMVPWHFTYDEFDMRKLKTLEVICDPTYTTAPEANDKAVRFLDFLWNEGLRIYGIGGSDSHNKPEERYEGGSDEPSIYGDPATYVYCEGLSVQNVIDGIGQGHCYAARYGALEITINDNKYLPGDEIWSEEAVIHYQVKLGDDHRPCIGKFLLNGEIVEEKLLNGENPSASYIFLNENEERWWLRFGLYDPEGHVMAYINPVYSKAGECKEARFKTLREKFERLYD